MVEDHLSSHTPLTPPQMEEDRLSWLRLLRSRRVGISTFFRLMREHGSAQKALEILPEIAASAGVSRYQICPEGVVIAELKSGAAAGAQLVFYGDKNYPKALADIPDPPPILWAIGDISLLKRPMIALVGARNASSLGTRMASALAKGLGENGRVIVSGLARGIDTAAHIAALGQGTIAVQAGGVDVIYPKENSALTHDIGKQGLRLSETPMGTTPQARHFPRRNRIISGLSQAVVVVEAAARSGSLITAKNALDQGRDVFAVPGHPFDARASGCNMLIRDGATLVRSAKDVIEATASPTPPEPRLPLPEPASQRSLADTSKLHQQILSRLGPSPVAEDQLIRDLDLAPQQVTPSLLNLELDGKITRVAGGLVSLAN